jgi:hypothetical protein
MSDDRTLLEKAARAAGIELRWHEPEWSEPWCYIPSAKPPHDRREKDKTAGVIWNPMDSDEDALRLAVKLKITWGYVGNFCVINDGTSTIGQPLDDDPYAATRRAIVRAAAASLGSLDEEKQP